MGTVLEQGGSLRLLIFYTSHLEILNDAKNTSTLGHTLEGGRWSQDFRSIFAKYDAKLRSATTEQGGKGGGENVV